MQDDFCLICAVEVETVEHILWECSFAMDVWSLSSKKIQNCSFVGLSLMELVVYMDGYLEVAEFELFTVIARLLWFRRNKFLYDDIF